MCWLILATALGPAFALPVEEAPRKLQGTWTTKHAFEAKSGSGYVLITFERTTPPASR